MPNLTPDQPAGDAVWEAIDDRGQIDYPTWTPGPLRAPVELVTIAEIRDRYGLPDADA